MEGIYRKPPPKYNILYTDATGEFRSVLVYTDEERNQMVAAIEAKGGTIMRIYNITQEYQ